MKKRELLIIAGFVAAAVIVYQLTARPREETSRGMSVSSMVNSIRREVAGNAATAGRTHAGTLPLSPGIDEIRLDNLNDVTVRGEHRDDIGYELVAEGHAPTEAEAGAVAEQTTLDVDNLGSVLALGVRAGARGRVSVRLTLQVPERLGLRLENQRATRALASGVSAVHLDTVGDVQLTGIRRTVTGSHRNGRLAIEEVGSADLSLVAADATFREIDGAITLDGRNGRVRIESTRGPLTLNVNSQDIVLVGPEGRVRIEGAGGGSVEVVRPRADVNIDARRTPVSLTLDQAVAVTALTSEAPLTLLLAGPPAIALDASTMNGRVQATALGLSPEMNGDDATLAHRFASADRRVVLRNTRGVIVIREAK